MDGCLIISGRKAGAGHGLARRASRCVLPALLVLAAVLIRPAPAAAQQDVAQDTAAADTTLTPRARALQRLRALPASPVQPDTLAADSLAADTLAADTLGPDSLPPRDRGMRLDPTGQQIFLADSMPMRDGPIREDSVRALLRSLEGYALTEYRSERAEFETEENQLRFTGASRVGRDRSALSADSLLVYNGDSGVVCGYGNPVLEGEQDPVQSELVCFDVRRDVGMAEGARTQFTQGATWYVRGARNRVYVLTGGDRNSLYGEQTEFTSCDLPEPHYVFRARALKMREDDMMVARDVTLRFGDVPVFWLPWMVQSMKRDRRSGLLMPQFSVNDIVRNQTGYNRRLSNLGFYWAINDYMSARTTFEWFSGNWTGATGAFSYRWLRQFLNGGVTLTHYWRETGSRDLTLSTANDWRPDERTRVNLSGNYASSSDFVQRNSFSPRELNRNLTIGGGMSRSFAWGSLNTSARRTQQLSTDKVTSELPSLSLTLSPLTLYTTADGGTSLTWNGSGSATRRLVDVQETVPGRGRDTEDRTASFSHTVGFGRFSIRQAASFNDDRLEFRPAIEPDSAFPNVEPDTALPAAQTERLTWNTGASFQQNLWTGTSLTPNITVRGGSQRDSRTEGAFVQEPARVSFGAGLNTSLYGFWPGFGPFSRIRHKISPTVSWSYSPAPAKPTELQEELFGAPNLAEQNVVSLRFNQTFEAKYAESDTATAGAGAESGEAGAAGAGEAGATGEPGEPRRLPQDRKITLLGLSTATNFQYDFVSARDEGRGFLTPSVTNSINSDLLRGFQLRTTHDLFAEQDPTLPATTVQPRRFDPFLTDVSASFSIDNNFWLFRALGLSGGAPTEEEVEEGFTDEYAEGPGRSRDPVIGAEADPNRDPGSVGAIVSDPGSRAGRPMSGGIGGWQAQLRYSLTRGRPEETRGRENQQVHGDLSFRATEHWSVRWSTGYSFTDAEFSNHMLTLSRDMHRWQANFDFVKAQNGNFSLSFRVNLLDNPDLKFDYDQHTDPSTSGLDPDDDG